jgi:hypothetical protein
LGFIFSLVDIFLPLLLFYLEFLAVHYSIEVRHFAQLAMSSTPLYPTLDFDTCIAYLGIDAVDKVIEPDLHSGSRSLKIRHGDCLRASE